MIRERKRLFREEPRWVAWTIGLMIMWEFVLMFDEVSYMRTTFLIKELELIILGRVLFLVPWKKEKMLWIFWGAVAVIFLSSAIRPMEVLQWSRNALRRTVLPYLLAPTVGLLLAEGDLKKLLKCVTALWTGLYAVVCVAALFCVLNGIQIYEPRLNWYIEVNKGALYMLGGKNNTGITIATSIAIAAVGCALFDRKWQKALFFVGILPMLAALPMTRCRTGYLGTSMGLGIAAACALQRPLARAVRKGWLRKGLSILVAVVIGVGMLPAFSAAIPIVNQLIEEEEEEEFLPAETDAVEAGETTAGEAADTAAAAAGAETESAVTAAGEAGEVVSAGAETEQAVTATGEAEAATNETGAAVTAAGEAGEAETESTALRVTKQAKTIKSRSFLKKNLLSGREKFWKASLTLLKEKPRLLLTGTSIPLIMEYVGEYMNTGIHEHVHCMPLQILLETGILGFALLIVFLTVLIRAAWKLFFSAETEGWKRILALPPAVIIMIDMVECTTRVNRIEPQIVFLCFFSALTLIMAKRMGKKQA